MASKKRQIYMDYAAGSPTSPNPSSIHSLGLGARRRVEAARRDVAGVLGCRPQEIIFTSGGTEGDNLAILGVPAGHIITSTIEHPAVLEPCRALEKRGTKVTYLPASPEGFVNPQDIKKALRPDTSLVSVMYANNEVGTVQPIAEIAKTVRRQQGVLAHGTRGGFADTPNCRLPLVHTDACQAPGYLPLNVAKLGVDLMTLSSAKFGGPQGVGCLYVKAGVKLSPLVYGGGQEGGLRSGTENVAGIVAMAKALVLAEKTRGREVVRLAKLRDYFARRLLETVPTIKFNYPSNLGVRLPSNLNIEIPGVEGEQLVIELDAIGVSASAGSACGASHWPNSVRFSMGKTTTKGDIDFIIKNLPEILGRIKAR